MTEPDPAPQSLLLMVMIFAILTLVGTVMLIFALVGQGGLLIGIVGALQSVVCAVMLGAAVRRWRSVPPPE